MKDFYVCWFVYNDDHETSDVIYRAVLSVVNQTTVLVQAGSLTPQVLKLHTDNENLPRDVVVGDIEVSARPLADWIAKLRDDGKTLPHVNLHDDTEEDE